MLVWARRLCSWKPRILPCYSFSGCAFEESPIWFWHQLGKDEIERQNSGYNHSLVKAYNQHYLFSVGGCNGCQSCEQTELFSSHRGLKPHGQSHNDNATRTSEHRHEQASVEQWKAAHSHQRNSPACLNIAVQHCCKKCMLSSESWQHFWGCYTTTAPLCAASEIFPPLGRWPAVHRIAINLLRGRSVAGGYTLQPTNARSITDTSGLFWGTNKKRTGRRWLCNLLPLCGFGSNLLNVSVGWFTETKLPTTPTQHCQYLLRSHDLHNAKEQAMPKWIHKHNLLTQCQRKNTQLTELGEASGEWQTMTSESNRK